MRELEQRERRIKELQGTGDRLLREEHPGRPTVEVGRASRRVGQVGRGGAGLGCQLAPWLVRLSTAVMCVSHESLSDAMSCGCPHSEEGGGKRNPLPHPPQLASCARGRAGFPGCSLMPCPPQAFQAALQTQWSWVLQLCCCIEAHLKENTAYFQVL